MKQLSCIVGVFVLLASSFVCFAIEGLKVFVRCPDVILRWPSVEGETYIVQYRQTVDTNSSWITLTNYLPADVGTNLTFFVHSNQVGCSSGSSFGGGGTSGGPAAPDSAMMQATLDTIAPVTQLDDATILFLAQHEVFPPYAWDLERRPPHVWELEARPPFPWDPGAFRPTEIESLPVRTVAPSGVSLNSSAENEPQPESDGDSGGDPPTCGFYRVVRDGAHLWGITNGMTFSGVVAIRVEVGNDAGGLASLSLTENNVPVGTASIQSAPFSGQLQLTMDTTQMSNGVHQISASARWEDADGGFWEADSPPVEINV